MSNALKQLSTEELVDLVSTQTLLYIQMHEQGASKVEFEQCKQLIQSVQKEINVRKQVKSR